MLGMRMRHNTLALTVIAIKAYFRWISHVARDYRPQTHTTTMPQTTQEEVEITALIRGILNGYPGNSAILREYLQNSDDAKASKQASFLSPLPQFIDRANDFCPKGLHTRRTDAPCRKYFRSFAEGDPRTGLNCL